MITQSGPRVAGVDLGATLAKLVLLGGEGERARFPSQDLEAVRGELERWQPNRIATTGGGAQELGAEFAGVPIETVSEFAAWGAGASELARAAAIELPTRYLLVSLGTGTSMLKVEAATAERVGGCALGGGAFLGLARLLAGSESFAAAAALAARGDRKRVDLLVGDIYRQGGIALPPDLNAASFGKLASTRAEDLADAVAGMIGENVALIAMALARAEQLETVVYCGSTLESNPALQAALSFVTGALGRRALYLPDGAYCGALGAAALAREGRG